MKRVYLTPKLKEHRHKQGYSIKEYADMLSIQTDENISPWSLSAYERGVRSINISLAVVIARYSGIDLKELVEKR